VTRRALSISAPEAPEAPVAPVDGYVPQLLGALAI
jgi:hypothetical protein